MPDAIDAPLRVAGAPAARVAARARLAAWLLDGPAQLREGPHAGAVAGVVRGHGAAYVYPEITGYYLQWLAGRARAGDAPAALAARAEGAHAWLSGWAQSSCPQARVYLAPEDDWRNGALFLFDLAMVLRGLASAAAAGLVVPDRKLIERLDALLVGLIADDGALDACRAHAGAGVLPRRWSTTRGAFLAKAAAGVLAAADLPGVSSTLLRAAQRTYELARRDALERPHAEAHPRLYAIEGLLAHDPVASCGSRVLAAQVGRLADEARADGRIAESVHDAGQPRVDVHAQALRAGVLLRAHGGPGAPDRATLVALADALAARVTPGGGLPFSLSSPRSEQNVWTAMFAEQALAWIDLPPRAAARCTAWIV